MNGGQKLEQGMVSVEEIRQRRDEDQKCWWLPMPLSVHRSPRKISGNLGSYIVFMEGLL